MQLRNLDFNLLFYLQKVFPPSPPRQMLNLITNIVYLASACLKKINKFCKLRTILYSNRTFPYGYLVTTSPSGDYPSVG